MSSMEGFMAKFQGSAGEDSSVETEAIAGAPDALAKFINKFNGGMDETSYWFYNHTIELRFQKDSWTYYKVGPLGELDARAGVTNSVHIIDKSLALVPWAAKMVVQKLLRTIPTITTPDGIIMLPSMSLEDFTKLVLEAKSAPRDILEEAGDIGHMAHTWLEYYIKAVIAKDTEKQQTMLTFMCKDERATNCAKAALAWMTAHNVRWIETERKIYSKEHGYAGTMDGLCIVDSCTDPACCSAPFKDHLSIADWKSSNYLYIEYLFQTAAYEGAFIEEFPEQLVTDRWILRLGKEDGEFEPWHLTAEDFPADYAGFLECLALTRKVDLVNDRMKAQKKVMRDAKKAAKAAAKEIAKLAERDEKARLKSEKKAAREIEKAKIKADAKIAREDAKVAKKLAKAMPMITRIVEDEAKVLELSPAEARVFVEAITNPPAPNEALARAVSSAVERHSYKVDATGSTPVQPTSTVEETVERKPFVIPTEK